MKVYIVCDYENGLIMESCYATIEKAQEVVDLILLNTPNALVYIKTMEVL